MIITKTCLYIILTPLNPLLNCKTGVCRVIHFFLSLLKNVDCGYSLVEAVLTSTHNLCFEQKYEKYQNFLSENFHLLVIIFSVYLNRHVFISFFFFLSYL